MEKVKKDNCRTLEVWDINDESHVFLHDSGTPVGMSRKDEILRSHLSKIKHNIEKNTEDEHDKLKYAMELLKKEVNQLKGLVEENLSGQDRKVVILSNITRDHAKEKILEVIRKQKGISYSEISEKIGLELKKTVEICSELESEGMIKGI